MTVKELKDILQKYDDDDVVDLEGGNSDGPSMLDYAYLSINGDTILEY